MDGVSSAGRIGRMHPDAEHLELLRFRRAEQQGEPNIKIRRPPPDNSSPTSTFLNFNIDNSHTNRYNNTSVRM